MITKLLAVSLMPYVLAMRVAGVVWETIDDTRELLAAKV